MLLVRGRRSQSAVARAVLERTRHPSTVSRRMGRERFRTRDMVRAEPKRQVTRELWRAKGREEVWFLLVDGVASKRGGRTKVENAIKYRRKGRGRKGRWTKARLFVQGLLITASGARIPPPRRSYCTREYVNRENRRLRLGRRRGKPLGFKTQQDPACLIVKELDLPDTTTLVVVADEYFEG